jgi:hypothetical protein
MREGLSQWTKDRKTRSAPCSKIRNRHAPITTKNDATMTATVASVANPIPLEFREH